METGYCWQPLYDGPDEAGYDVRLAHPQKVKTDHIDSETLAHLLRAGLLPESYVPPQNARAHPRARLLTTIPVVGYYIVLLLISEIGDVRRFPDSEKRARLEGLLQPRIPSHDVEPPSTWL